MKEKDGYVDEDVELLYRLFFQYSDFIRTISIFGEQNF